MLLCCIANVEALSLVPLLLLHFRPVSTGYLKVVFFVLSAVSVLW